MGFSWVDLVSRARAREISIFFHGRRSLATAREGFAVFSDIQSTVLFARASVVSAKLLSEIFGVLHMVFVIFFFTIAK